MTYQQKFRQNTKLIRNYDAFLPHCESYDDRLKLIVEISRLYRQNMKIQGMSFQESKNRINSFHIEAVSVFPKIKNLHLELS